jgi:cytochrome c-type biogenesis protein CcmF
LLEDLYVILSYWEQEGQLVSLKAVVNPLIVWMWIGGGVLVLGTLVAVWPVPHRMLLEQRAPRIESLPASPLKDRPRVRG